MDCHADNDPVRVAQLNDNVIHVCLFSPGCHHSQRLVCRQEIDGVNGLVSQRELSRELVLFQNDHSNWQSGFWLSPESIELLARHVLFSLGSLSKGGESILLAARKESSALVFRLGDGHFWVASDLPPRHEQCVRPISLFSNVVDGHAILETGPASVVNPVEPSGPETHQRLQSPRPVCVHRFSWRSAP